MSDCFTINRTATSQSFESFSWFVSYETAAGYYEIIASLSHLSTIKWWISSVILAFLKRLSSWEYVSLICTFVERKKKSRACEVGRVLLKHCMPMGPFFFRDLCFWKFSQQNRKATVLKLRTIAQEVVHTMPTKRSYNCRRTFNTIGNLSYSGTRSCIKYHRHKNSQSIDTIASSTALGS